MESKLQNLPVLFDRVGAFIERLAVLQEGWPRTKPEVEALFERHSQSAVDQAKEDYKGILDMLYDATARGCPSGSTRMMGR